MTAIVYSTSTTHARGMANCRKGIAAVASAPTAEVVAARNAAIRLVDTLRAEGATEVGIKVCDDMGKHRRVLDIDDAAGTIAYYYADPEADVEVWGITGEGVSF